MKNTIIAILVIAAILIGGYFLLKQAPETTEPVDQTPTTTPVTETPSVQGDKTVIGDSVQGRDIVAYHYGEGETKLLFVGGIHGGYEWNTSLVAYELMDYLDANPNSIPDDIQVTVVPVLNPDGLFKVVGATEGFTAADVSASQDVVVSGRFNANNVDLNRNFDCGWQKTGVWQSKPVSGGSKAFSEPESRAMRDFVTSYQPDAVVVWYSAAGGVFASSCDGDAVSPETTTLTSTFAKASGYPAFQSFDFYEITGDMVNWLAKNDIPAVSVLLTNHTDTEWSKNLAGVQALFTLYSK